MEESKQYAKEWYYKNHEENKRKKREYSKKWRDANIEHARERDRLYAVKWRAANKDKVKETKNKIKQNLTKEKIEKNKEYERKYRKAARSKSAHTKIKSNYRSRIGNAFRRARQGKKTKSYDLLGCDIATFISHLSSLFEPWMNFDNYGRASKFKRTWNIDHVVPVSRFNLSDPEECKKAFHYTNTKPMEGIANSAKGDKLV